MNQLKTDIQDKNRRINPKVPQAKDTTGYGGVVGTSEKKLLNSEGNRAPEIANGGQDIKSSSSGSAW
jgi:hypothetical protein